MGAFQIVARGIECKSRIVVGHVITRTRRTIICRTSGSGPRRNSISDLLSVMKQIETVYSQRRIVKLVHGLPVGSLESDVHIRRRRPLALILGDDEEVTGPAGWARPIAKANERLSGTPFRVAERGEDFGVEFLSFRKLRGSDDYTDCSNCHLWDVMSAIRDVQTISKNTGKQRY
jgi:hypothetical protein